MATPWMTTDDLIAAVKRKISFPISQNTFSEEDIIQFANEEMFIAQVPSVLQYHEEYFVYRVQTPLVSNISRYSIPNRAIGMKLRDLMWSDSSGNYFEMTRINSDDKAFFQRNIGANQAIHKFYLEGNDVVLTPSVVGGPTGALNFFIYLRPNQLVSNSRGRIIESFSRTLTINSPYEFKFYPSNIDTTEDTISIQKNTFSSLDVNTSNNEITIISHGYENGYKLVFSSDSELPAPLEENTVYYVVNKTVNTFQLSLTENGSVVDLTTQGVGPHFVAIPHNYANGTKVYLYSAGTLPSGISNSTPYYVIPVDALSFKISETINGAGFDFSTGGIGDQFISSNFITITTGSQTISPVSYVIPVLPRPTVSACLSQLQTTINSYLTITSSISSPPNIIFTFNDITYAFGSSNESLISVSSQIGFNFDSELSSIFSVGSKIDLLQTLPGHRTYIFDVVLQAISGSIGYFNYSDLLVYLSTGFGFTPQIINIQVGDYMCLANESIIPQIPPDLHNVLAERTAARILAAIGDQAGLAITNQKIAEMENRQGNLLDQRSEGTPQKITARNSLLRYGKMGVRRRM
jgi:hypothetical protein